MTASFKMSATRRFGGGFTLVELLVTMVLLSMVMVALMSVMRSMAQAQEKVEHRLSLSDDFRVATAFLESAIGHVSARRSSRGLQVGESPYQLIARPQELVWVGVMPARFGMGGRSYFRLALEPGRAGAALVLRFAPWEDTAGFPDWTRTEAFEVVQGVTSFSLFYEDAWQPTPLWVSRWERLDSIPARVRIEVATEEGAWPLWIVPMRWLPAYQPGAGRFTSGG